MSTRPAGAVPIAPSRAPAGAGDPARPRAVAHSDIVFANGQAFNGRGYRVCGVANQRGTLCGRIGTCPFHAGQTPGLPAARVPKRRRSRAEPDAGGVGSGGGDPAAKAARVDGGGASAGAAAAAGSAASASTLPECVRRLDTPPAKMRFKRSWTPDEHRQFLASMKKFGKGKWKEIAREVGTRTANQCQSHAQKYFLRQAKSDKERKKKSIHDLTDEPPPTAAPAAPAAAAPAAPAATAATVVPPAPHMAELVPAAAADARSAAAASAPPPYAYAAAEPADTHPGLAGVDALASAALAEDAATRHRDAVNKALSAALANAASEAAASNAAVRAAAKAEPVEADAEDGETEDEDGADDDDDDPVPEKDATAPPPPPPAQGVNVQALALAALAAAAMSGGAGGAAAPGKAGAAGGAALPVMLPVSALQGSFSQLMANPQAMMMLNPLLASMSAANAAVGGPAAAAVAPPPPPPPPARLRVTVHKNGFKGGGMALMLPDSMPEFFALAKSKLVFDGVFHRVFTRSGGEITSLDQMVQDDALWLSRGEEFATPT